MKTLPLLLACLSLAPAQRKGAQDLVDLAKRPASAGKTLPLAPGRPASIIRALYSADFSRSYTLRTNYPAPSPGASPQEAPTVKAVPISRAVAPPAKPVILPNFVFPTNAAQFPYWHRLDSDSPGGPWKTNVTNMAWPPSGTQDVPRTNARGFFKMFGTKNPI